jgi:hypothetical protein
LLLNNYRRVTSQEPLAVTKELTARSVPNAVCDVAFGSEQRPCVILSAGRRTGSCLKARFVKSTWRALSKKDVSPRLPITTTSSRYKTQRMLI